jgi:hypothetical protein
LFRHIIQIRAIITTVAHWNSYLAPRGCDAWGRITHQFFQTGEQLVAISNEWVKTDQQ